MRRARWLRRRGFTDSLYFINLILTWLFVAVCVGLTVAGAFIPITDYTIVSVGVPAVFAELSIHTGFIIWKAKAENMAKHNAEGITMEG